MNRYDYFIAAMKDELYRRYDWVISAFAQVQEDPNAWKKNPYFYRLVHTPTGIMYVNPNNTEELLPITDSVPNAPPFVAQDKISLTRGQLPNVVKDIETTYGNVLYNCMVLIYGFGNKIPFQTGKINAGKIEALIIERLVDTPMIDGVVAPAASRDPSKLYVDEYLKFVNATFYLSNFAALWVPAGTPKSLLAPPDIKQVRDGLLEQYKDRLDDPQAVAMISKALLDHDKQWLAGDDAVNSMLKEKAFEVVRARKFLMYGAEAGLSDSVKVDLVQNSLAEGLNPDKFATINNSQRAGSFNRGAQTMLGGELVKWLLRASSNINVLPNDCGSKLGKRMVLEPSMRKKYLNFHIQTPSGAVQLTDDVIDSYLGKPVVIRNPQYCKAALTDFCSVCVGPRLAADPTAVSAAVSDYGSVLMLIYMKAMHGKALTVAKYNYKTSLT